MYFRSTTGKRSNFCVRGEIYFAVVNTFDVKTLKTDIAVAIGVSSVSRKVSHTGFVVHQWPHILFINLYCMSKLLNSFSVSKGEKDVQLITIANPVSC